MTLAACSSGLLLHLHIRIQLAMPMPQAVLYMAVCCTVHDVPACLLAVSVCPHRPQYIATYFNQPDHDGHTYGPYSNQARRWQIVTPLHCAEYSLTHTDTAIARLVDAVKHARQYKHVHTTYCTCENHYTYL